MYFFLKIENIDFISGMWTFECNTWHMVITNSVQNIKERCKTVTGANTNLKIGSRIRRYGGMSIYCWPVKSAVYFLSQLGKQKNPYTRLYRWSWLKAYWVYILNASEKMTQRWIWYLMTSFCTRHRNITTQLHVFNKQHELKMFSFFIW